MDGAERRLRIDVVVQGRFFAFDLVRALMARGHDVRLVTTYPGWLPPRWGVAREAVRGRGWQYPLWRAFYRLRARRLVPDLEPKLLASFSRWASGQLRADADAVVAFSGVAEEVFAAAGPRANRLLVRASSHIRTQHDLLAQEERRCGMQVERPSDWIMAREVREYSLARRIIVLSTFSRDSFVAQGVHPDRVALLPLAVDAGRFRAGDESVRERRRRIAAGEPLRVLMVGSFTPRKGAVDFVAVASTLQGRMRFRFVGDLPAAGSPLRRQAEGLVELVARVPEDELAPHYAWGDVFCLPTIEDGFPVVISQALAAQLPAIVTANCSGPDVIRDGGNGWIVPARSPDQLARRLSWCDAHRHELGAMVESMPQQMPARSWDDVARDFEGLVHD